MAITNLVNTATEQFWEDGQIFLGQYGDSGEPVLETQSNQFWENGQIFLYPFQNIAANTGVYNKIQLMIITMSGL